MVAWLQGKKTHGLAAIGVGMALYMYVNGMTDGEMAAFMALVSGLASTLRAGIEKGGGK